ncbi:hypothetical protein WJX73_005987 [Symbiochloris irregularis]|uniref:protein acetyllysine N-acetyltransferase n=1 Tax=Symbiochloris irregularis TaxID=706552 RepID=A0AAW1P101_9CHLO
MSVGYAERLSFREDLGGQLGDPELAESSPEALNAKVIQLAQWIQEASRIVAFTGAGISTSCGIPDFRGPRGVWTLQREKKPLPAPKVRFAHAVPSVTHQVLRDLVDWGKLTYIVSQNVDGLHLRSGVPREKLAELHGNCFAERCPRCSVEYVRDFEMQTVGFRHTGRTCKCGGRLKDSILDWEDALPETELQASEQHASQADLAICLGTSLQITPACNLPLRTKRAGGRIVIINLQKTPKDKQAALVLHARCDEVMAGVMGHLGRVIPPFIRTDALVLPGPPAAEGRDPAQAAPLSLPQPANRRNDGTLPRTLCSSKRANASRLPSF